MFLKDIDVANRMILDIIDSAESETIYTEYTRAHKLHKDYFIFQTSTFNETACPLGISTIILSKHISISACKFPANINTYVRYISNRLWLLQYLL